MEALDEIEAKLKEMRELAECARDNELNQAKRQEINDRLQKLKSEVNELDGKCRVPWVDNQ